MHGLSLIDNCPATTLSLEAFTNAQISYSFTWSTWDDNLSFQDSLLGCGVNKQYTGSYKKYTSASPVLITCEVYSQKFNSRKICDKTVYCIIPVVSQCALLPLGYAHPKR